MEHIKRTADCMYRKFLRINRHDYYADDIASLLLAFFVFGTMWVSISQIY